MELGFGGPVWHISVRPFSGNQYVAHRAAELILDRGGLGDRAAGEWQEAGNGGVFHIRRRLSAAECELGGGLVVRDIRGTLEEQARLRALMAALDPAARARIIQLMGRS